MRAPARLAAFSLAATVVGMTPSASLGQETGSDDHVASVTELVSAASLALVAGPGGAAPTPAAFVAAVQLAVAQAQVDPGGEPQARAQLGNFRTSLLMKAGVLSFDGTPASVPVDDGEAEQQGLSWATWVLMRTHETADPDVMESGPQEKRPGSGRWRP